MNKKYLFSVIIASLMTFESGAQATGSYGYFPDLSVMLGKGFNSQYADRDYRLCFTGIRSVPLNNNVADSSQVEMTIVKSSSDLRRVFGLDTKIEASYLVFSGSANFSINSESEVHENDVNIVVQASAAYSGESLDPTLLNYTPEIRALIQSGNFRRVREICGPELVNTVKKGAKISVLVRIKGLSDSQKTAMDLKISGGGGFGPLSARAEQHLNALFQSSSTNVSISAKVYTQGGSGLPALAKFAEMIDGGSDSMSKIKEGIENVMRDLGPEHAAVIGFKTVEFPEIDPSIENLVSDFKTDALLRIVNLYRFEKSRFDILGRLFYLEDFRQITPSEFSLINSEMLRTARADMQKVRRYLMILGRTHQRCITDTSEELDACLLPVRPEVPSYLYVQDFLSHL